jgi:long-chain acyl-CoA synthetase
MIIRSGTNVYPAEVENVLCRVPGVSEAALVGIPDPEAGEELAAFVVGDGTVTEATLVAFCRTHLAPDKRPRVFRIVDALPRSDNGKILKRELRDLLANGSANSVKE